MQDLADNSGGSGAGIDDTVTANDSTWSSTKINSEISSGVSSGLSSYDSTLRNGYSGTLKELYDDIQYININSGFGTDDISKYPPVNPNLNRCILSITNEKVSSDYNYTLKGLHNVLNSADWSQYIRNGDYISLTLPTGQTFNMAFNIDTYYDANADGTTSKIATHHIDMISKSLIDGIGNVSINVNSKGNNGTAKQPNPYLASSTKEINGAYNKLVDYYNNIPFVLKSHIIKKKLVVPYRYQSGSTLSKDNGKGLEELPELWIPFYKEIFGSALGSYDIDMRQYTTHNTDSLRKIHTSSQNTSSYKYLWWTASAKVTDSQTFAGIYCATGNTTAPANAPIATYGSIPLCFRFV